MAAAMAACTLLALTGAYYLTYEPAPRVGVLWRAGIGPERRAALERRFLLVNPTVDRDRLAYDLLDTSRGNLEALVTDPDAEDTDRISQERFEVPFDIPYGESWMWVAYRIPILRIPGVVSGIVATSVLLLVGGLVAEGMWRWRRLARSSRGLDLRQRGVEILERLGKRRAQSVGAPPELRGHEGEVAQEDARRDARRVT